MGIVDKAIANSVPVIPRPIVKKISSRYIAGDTLDEALATVGDLNEQGCARSAAGVGICTCPDPLSGCKEDRTRRRE